jgi:hypothetical protein
MPESTLIPQSGTMNLATGLRYRVENLSPEQEFLIRLWGLGPVEE